MPSDLVWVALITSGAVLSSAWLTARFTAASTKQQIDAQIKTTQSQIEAQAEISKRQIELQESEARRDRVIVARTDTLTRIQDSLGSLFGAHSTFTSSVIGLQELDKSGVWKMTLGASASHKKSSARRKSSKQRPAILHH